MNYYSRITEIQVRHSLSQQGLSEEQINEFLGSFMKGIGSGIKAGVSAGVDRFKKDRAEKKAKSDANNLAKTAQSQRQQMRRDPKSLDPKKFKETQLAAANASAERRKAFSASRGLSTANIGSGLDAAKKLSGDRYVQSWRTANRNPIRKRTYGSGMMVSTSTYYGDVANLIRESYNLK